mmetsp:Transcript_32717/g.76062  ORF Transcript_32717/g.76062 Transcript_32717/m.76062 type:complete len:440 (-) Transcript_32717:100-1419(-)
MYWTLLGEQADLLPTVLPLVVGLIALMLSYSSGFVNKRTSKMPGLDSPPSSWQCGKVLPHPEESQATTEFGKDRKSRQSFGAEPEDRKHPPGSVLAACDLFGCCGARPPNGDVIGKDKLTTKPLDSKYGFPKEMLISTVHVPVEEDIDGLLAAALPASANRSAMRRQLQAFAQVAASVPPSGWVQPTDLRVLLRFLVARRGNIEKALEFMHSVIEWREQWGVNRALVDRDLEPHEALDRYWKVFGVLGHDRDGDPVLWDRMGRCHPASLGKCSEAWSISHEIYTQELLMACLAQERQRHSRAGRSGGYGFTVVIDLEGLSLSHMDRRGLHLFQLCCRLDTDRYPEIVKRVLIVRAPSIFPLIWKIVRSFLDAGTREKIEIVPEANTRQAILEHIPEEDVPQALGGRLCLSGDPYCGSVIPSGGPVPDSELHRYRVDPTP